MGGIGTMPRRSRPYSPRMPTLPIGGAKARVDKRKLKSSTHPCSRPFSRTATRVIRPSRLGSFRPDVVALDVHWELTGARDPQGNPRPDRQGLLNFVMAKNAGEWQIMVMHNLDLTALPPPNLRNSATTKP